MGGVLFYNGTPLYWSNHSLFKYAEKVGFETIDEALQNIAGAFIDISSRKGGAKMTIRAGVVLAHMFDAAIDTGYLMLGQQRPNEPNLPFDFAVDAEAIQILMALFSDYTSAKPAKGEQKKS
jgi:hypothetical protein